MLRPLLRSLAPALLAPLGACGEAPCMDGYGRDARGACVPVSDGATGGAADGGTTDGGATGGDTGGGADGGDTDGDTTDGGATDSGADSGTDGGSTEPAFTPPDPSWSPEQVAEAVDEVFRHGMVTALDYNLAWKGIMDAGRDEECPGADYWLTEKEAGCWSDAGFHYSGYASHTEIDSGSAYELDITTDGFIRDADGELFLTSMDAGYFRASEGASEELYYFMFGSVQYPPAGGWLAAGLSAMYSCEGERSGGQAEMSCSGGYGVIEAGELFFEGLDISPGCDGATGALQIREPTGYWYQVALDCSSCGPLTFDDRVELGEVCLDLTAMHGMLDAMAAAP